MRQRTAILSLATIILTSANANAQYYGGGAQGNPYYAQQRTYYTNPRPSYVPPQYTASQYKYNKPQQTLQRSIYDRRISVGIDYQVGLASYGDTEFTVESPLAGGVDYKAGMRDFDRQIHGLQFNIGWRILKNLGLEAFYTHSLDKKNVEYIDSYSGYPEFAEGAYSIYYKAYGIDALGFYPVNDFIEFIASIGVGKYDAEAKVKISVYENDTHDAIRSNSKTFSESVMGYRIGGGLQMWISKHIAFRIMGRWVHLGGDFMNYVTEINAGVRYHF